MPIKPPKTATASNDTVKSQLIALSRDFKSLKETHDTIDKENRDLKRQLSEANNFIEGDLRADLIQRIKGKSTYLDVDLAELPLDELMTIDKTLSMSKGADKAECRTNSVRSAGASAESHSPFGDLYGKKQGDISSEGDA